MAVHSHALQVFSFYASHEAHASKGPQRASEVPDVSRLAPASRADVGRHGVTCIPDAASPVQACLTS